MKIDLKVIKDNKLSRHGMGMFCVARDEIYFLPFLLEHYRRLGVEHFLFYDDKSSDGSREFLQAQPDCAVVTSDLPYGALVDGRIRYCHVLKGRVPKSIFGDRWVLTVDADEFLLLPEPFIDLQGLCAAIEREKGNSAIAALVDFYPEKLNMRNYPTSLSPFSVNRFCDKGPLFEWRQGRRKPQAFNAGIRYRLGQMLSRFYPSEFLEIFPSDEQKHHKGGKLWKVPLVKLESGNWLVNDHELNVPPFLGLQMALAHFKFYPGLDRKIVYALESKSYFGASRNYRMLERVVHHFGDESLLCGHSVEVKSRRDLEKASLLYPMAAQR
jgi:hypothetical protein